MRPPVPLQSPPYDIDGNMMPICERVLRSSRMLCCALLLCAMPLRAAVIPDDALKPDVLSESDLRGVNALMAEKRFDDAMKQIELFERSNPRDPNVFILKGAAYLAKGDVVNARKSFEHAENLNPRSMAALMNLAQLDVLQKDPQAAERRFQNVLKEEPANTEAMIGMASVAGAQGRDADYKTWVDKAVAADPKAVRPRVLLANYYLHNKDVQAALLIARQAQSLDPNNAQVLDALGTAQMGAGDFEGASRSYRQLTSVLPGDAEAHYKLATAQYAQQDARAAKTSLYRSLQLKPDLLAAEIMLASIELKAGRYVESMQVAKDVQKQYPSSSVGMTLEGDVLMEQRQYAEARRAYEKAFATRKSGTVAVKLHQALAASGKNKDAEAVVIDWLKAEPGDLGTRRYLAMEYVKLGQRQQAVEQYERIVKAEPGNAVVASELAALYQHSGDRRALPLAEQAYKLAPQNAFVLDTLGWLLVANGDAARGLQVLRTAAQLEPSSAMIRYHLAAALAKAGQANLARTELQTLLSRKTAFDERPQAEALLKQLGK